MQRRDFLKGLLLGAAGLAVPPVPPLALAAPVRRLWALDGTMLGGGAEIATAETLAAAEAFVANTGRVVLQLRDSIEAFDRLADFRAPDAETVEDWGAAWREYTYPIGAIQIGGQAYTAHDLRITMSEPRGGRGVSPLLRTIQGRYGA